MKPLLHDIKREKIIAIIRGVPSEFIIETAKALVSGGIHMMEITFDQESPEGIKNTLDSLTILNEQMHDEIALGAGTVLTAEQVELAYERGAGYVISPNVDQDVIQKTKELGMISIPGALTATEVVQARGYGADIVKLFPAGIWGAGYIKALCAPLSHIPVAAVGGVDENNIQSFFQAGACCVGIGGSLVSRKRILNREFERITKAAETLRKQVEAWELTL